MKIALAQINTATGDLDGNEKKIRQYLEKATQEKCDLVIFPELTLVGYPPRDFLMQHGFLEKADSIIKKIAKDFSNLAFVIGSVERYSNVAFVASSGSIQVVCRKNLLPNYDVFDERRYFRPGSELEIVEILNKKIGITICEDIWAREIPIYNNDPMKQFRGKEIDFIINISASPFESTKHEKRLKVVSQNAKTLAKPVIYVNLVGGNDELIFDGGSFMVDANGKVLWQTDFFKEEFFCFDTDHLQPKTHTKINEEQLLIEGLTMGLKDFVHKTGFRDVVLGLSGGIDSAMVLLLALEAFGKEHVHPVFMPSKYTSQISTDDVQTMIKKLGLSLTTIPIHDMVDSFTNTLQSSLKSTLKMLTLENLQSRIRGVLLMATSAEKNALVINTGNKSEFAVGYATLYGDIIGAVSPLGDLYKYQVYALAKKLNEKYQAIPDRIFTRAPSAELKENQKDTDSLPGYDILDPIVHHYVEQQQSPEEIIKHGFSKPIVDSMVFMMNQNEFKRKQCPPILRVSSKAFGIGRRMPIARKLHEI